MHPREIVSGFLSSVASVLMKWLWSLKATATTKTAITGRPMMKFESGYIVETVFDGSKLGIEPYSVELLPSGELLVLDSANSNLYKISSPLSQWITTIAGGKWGRGGGHVDGPSEDAKFSNDFDVVYIGSSCSLLVIDRGNQAIWEIQLHFDDCAYQYGSGFPLGIAVLVAAGFFGYMLALLQRRVGTIVSPPSEDERTPKQSIPPSPYQKSMKSSVRPPLIPTEDDQEKHEEGLFGSLGKLLVNTGASVTKIFAGIFPGFRKKSPSYQYQQPQQHKYSNAWPVQESFVIPDEDEPPSIETRTPTPRKMYPFMSKDAEKMQQLRQSRAFYSGWDGDFQQQQQKQQQHHHHQYHSSPPQTYFEQSFEKTNEVVFGAVQEQDAKREATVIKPLDYGNSFLENRNFCTRSSSRYHQRSSM